MMQSRSRPQSRDTESEQHWLGDQPQHTEIFPAEARYDLAHQQCMQHAALDSQAVQQ